MGNALAIDCMHSPPVAACPTCRPLRLFTVPFVARWACGHTRAAVVRVVSTNRIAARHDAMDMITLALKPDLPTSIELGDVLEVGGA